MRLDPLQAIIDDTIDVIVENQTLILIGCKTKVTDVAIKPGVAVRAVGKLSEGDLIAVVLFIEEQQDYGTIIAMTDIGGGYNMNFYQLKENDEITVFGLEACLEDKIDFYGFVIVVSEKDDKDSDDCNWVNTLPNFLTDNNVKICLESDFYTDNLTINGNNFSLIGEANNECGDEYWTTLSGKVKINGNNAIFKNIKFTGERDKNGNNLKFINCCFKDKPI